MAVINMHTTTTKHTNVVHIIAENTKVRTAITVDNILCTNNIVHAIVTTTNIMHIATTTTLNEYTVMVGSTIITVIAIPVTSRNIELTTLQ